MLLHSGWPNPGLTTSLKRFSSRWERADLPIIVHLLGSEAPDLRRMAPRVEELDNVMAIELGLPPDSGPELAADLIRAALGEVPLIVQLPFESALDLAEAAIRAGANALSLAVKRSSLEQDGGQAFRGRLYGASLFDEALETTRDLCELGIPVIGSGGVYSAEQARRMLEAGAIAVQLDTVLWKADTNIGLWDLGESVA
ncbi:MAG: hypothetical protein DWG76_06465 [Chloroflexi bacterium]|nr:hypothetical protein [Chloroflexota bacterium]